MYKFSAISAERLSQAHSDLQIIFSEVLTMIDCSILCAYRNEEEQNAAYHDKKSQLKYPDSKHNSLPARAIDAAPYPIDWQNVARLYFFAGVVIAVSDNLYKEKKTKHRIRWGGDWDGDKDFNDERFRDFVHFELT